MPSHDENKPKNRRFDRKDGPLKWLVRIGLSETAAPSPPN